MSDNFNVNTTQAQSLEAGGMDPNNPGLTLWDAMNKNAMTQQEQAQLVQQAIEKTKQAQLQTKEETEDDSDGARQAGKGLISKGQAITTLKAGLANSSIEDDQKAAVLKDAEDTWPDVVSADGVHRMITALHEGRITKLGEGEPFEATGTETDADGNKFPKGTMLQDIVDTSGDHHYVQSAERASVQNHDNPTAGGDDKSWQKLDAEENKFVRNSRGNSLAQAIQRADRAINELNDAQTLTPQVLSYIQKDVSGIFQGGVPPVAGQDAEDFTTTYQKLNGLIQKYTGVNGYLHSDLGNQRVYLQGLLSRLHQSTYNILKAAIASEAAGYENIIHADPSRWKEMVDEKMAILGAGVLKPSTGVAPSAAAPQSTGNPQAAVPQYTVEE